METPVMTRYFVAGRDSGEPTALARVHGTTAAERFVAGGTAWEDYPRLIRIAFDLSEMSWDEITAAEADKVQQRIASKAS